MGRHAKNDDEKAVKLSISLPAAVYKRISEDCEKPPKKKISRFIADLILKSYNIYH